MENKKHPDYLETAYSIGKRLCRDAIWHNEECNWLGPVMEFQEGQWQVIQRIADGHLYGGTSGIALFLGHLYELTQDDIIKQTAMAAMNHALKSTKNMNPERRIGFHTGSLGIAYAAYRLGEVLPDSNFMTQGFDLLRDHFKENPPSGELLDVISGSAGAIPVFVTMHQKNKEDNLSELGDLYAKQLIKKATYNKEGWSWSMPNMVAYEDLLGYSHGAAGVAMALLEAYDFLKDESYKDAALHGFRYEQSWFDSNEGNWPDMRDNHNRPRPEKFGFSCQWCHGAAGILLTRARAWQILGDDDFRLQAEVAGKTTISTLENPDKFGLRNYSLCHGIAGNALTLLYGHQVLNSDQWLNAAQMAARKGIAEHHRQNTPWLGGVADPVESLSLMLGTAGTGYFYLRMYDSKSVPPILIIAPEHE